MGKMMNKGVLNNEKNETTRKKFMGKGFDYSTLRCSSHEIFSGR
jgi:hypothetical protein